MASFIMRGLYTSCISDKIDGQNRTGTGCFYPSSDDKHGPIYDYKPEFISFRTFCARLSLSNWLDCDYKRDTAIFARPRKRHDSCIAPARRFCGEYNFLQNTHWLARQNYRYSKQFIYFDLYQVAGVSHQSQDQHRRFLGPFWISELWPAAESILGLDKVSLETLSRGPKSSTETRPSVL